jgi:enamidase
MLRKLLIGAGITALLLFVGGALFFHFTAYRGQDPQTGRMALVNGQFLTMVGDEPDWIRGMAMTLEDGVISGFEPAGALPDDIARVDLEGGYAVPGLFDAHVHLGGLPVAEGLGLPGMILEYMRAFPGAREKFLAWGVTTVVSLGDGHPSGVELRDHIARGELAGPRLVVAGPMLTAPGGHPVSTIFRGNDMAIEFATRQLDDVAEARAEVDRLAADEVDLIKVIYTAGRNDALPRMRYEVLEAIVGRAHERGLRVVVHTDTRVDLEDALRAGADGLEHLALGLGEARDSLLPQVAARSMGVVPTLAVMQAMGSEERMAAVLDEFATWLDYDIPVVLGTDAGNVPAGEPVYDELRLLVRAGMQPYDAWQAATINAARRVGLDHVLGSLAQGKHADVVVFDQHPLDALPHLRQPKMVFKEGVLVSRR